MKDICVVFVVIFSTIFGLCYSYRVWKKRADPTLSTWIIFFVGCVLSFTTYVLSEKWDVKSGILNTIDLVYVVIILTAIVLWGQRKGKQRLEPFEKWYLAGAAAIVIYGVATGDMWSSNVLTQILMSLAYFPMFQKFFREKKNFESFFAWLPATLNSMVALYPALHDGNSLAVVYSARALILSGTTCLIMLYYQRKNRKLKLLH